MSSTLSSQKPGLSKKAAFLIHFALSALIFMTLVAVMAVFWFPGKLFFLDGGWQGLKIVALIDVVLGPALTLLLYAPGKPKLLLDMSMIASLQIAALVFGFITTYQQRTVAIVYADQTFSTLSAAAMKAANEDLANRNLPTQLPADIDNSKPAMLHSPEPGPGEYARYVDELLSGFPEPHERSDKFRPLSEYRDNLVNHALDEDVLKEINMHELVMHAMNKKQLNTNEVQFHPYKTRFSSGVAIIDPKMLKILDFVPVPKQAADATSSNADTNNQAQNSDQQQTQPIKLDTAESQEP